MLYIISDNLAGGIKGPGDNQISGIAGLFASPTPDTRRIQISPLKEPKERYGIVYTTGQKEKKAPFECERGRNAV